MTKSALVTLCDYRHTAFSDLTHPLMRDYASRIGCDFIVIRDRRYPNDNINYEKFQMADLLGFYDRVVYVDTDVIVRLTAPNILEEVPEDRFGAMNEAKNILFWAPEHIDALFRPYGSRKPNYDRYFNAGLMVFSKMHRHIFENPVILEHPPWDQNYINYTLQERQVEVHELDRKWNYMVFHRYADLGNLPEEAYFLHFTGPGTPMGDRISAIEKEVFRWSEGAILSRIFSKMEGESRLTGSEIAFHMPTLYLLAKMPSPGPVVELGVGKGFSTLALLSGAYARDAMVFSYDTDPSCEKAALSTFEFPAGHPILKHWRFAEKDSISAAEHFGDGTVGLLFIDTVHSYEHTRAELSVWIKKIHERGIICGHDYMLEGAGVARAVEEVVAGGPYKLQVFPNSQGLFILWPRDLC